MNVTQEINGKLYERVPEPKGRCTGCAFYTPTDDIRRCQLLGQDVSCTQPEPVIFVKAKGAVLDVDEQCGVGNG